MIMKKQCGKCKSTIDIKYFNKKSKKSNGDIIYQSYCKECNKIRSKKYYRDNIEKHKKQVSIKRKKFTDRNNKIVLDYLKTHPCIDCGITDVRVLEFDHVRGDKKTTVSQLRGSGFSENTLLEEISKCEVRCANCHRIKTYSTFGAYKCN